MAAWKRPQSLRFTFGLVDFPSKLARIAVGFPAQIYTQLAAQARFELASI